MRGFHWLIALAIFALSCKSNRNAGLLEPFESDSSNSEDSQADSTGLTYTSLRRGALLLATKQMKIPLLENGIKGFEVRIWAPVSGESQMNLMTLKNIDGNWQYSSTRFVYSQPVAEKDSLHPMLRAKVESFKTYAVRPKINERLFLDSLEHLGLQHSPTQAQWDFGLLHDTGNNAYTFEIANESSYRMFTYICAERFREEMEYDKKVKAFLRLLKKHFSFDFEECRY